MGHDKQAHPASQRARQPINPQTQHIRNTHQLVDRVQVERRLLLCLPARQKHHARDRRRHDAPQHAQRARRDDLRGRLWVGALGALHDHLRLEQRRLERDAAAPERGDARGDHALRGGAERVSRVRPVDEQLRLHDRHQSGGLADLGVLGELVCVDLDRQIRGEGAPGRPLLDRGDAQRRAPLGELRAGGDVPLAARRERLEAARARLAGLAALQRLQALVHLDAREHALAREQLDEGRAVRGGLVERLAEEDDA